MPSVFLKFDQGVHGPGHCASVNGVAALELGVVVGVVKVVSAMVAVGVDVAVVLVVAVVVPVDEMVFHEEIFIMRKKITTVGQNGFTSTRAASA